VSLPTLGTDSSACISLGEWRTNTFGVSHTNLRGTVRNLFADADKSENEPRPRYGSALSDCGHYRARRAGNAVYRTTCGPPWRFSGGSGRLREAKKDTAGTEESALHTLSVYLAKYAEEVKAFEESHMQSQVPIDPPQVVDDRFKDVADLFRLGDVYFNQNRTLALTFFSSWCGRLCALWQRRVFEKLESGAWVERLGGLHDSSPPLVGCRLKVGSASPGGLSHKGLVFENFMQASTRCVIECSSLRLVLNGTRAAAGLPFGNNRER